MWVSAFTCVRPGDYRAGMLLLAEFYWPAGASVAEAARRARAGAASAAGTGAAVRFIQAIFVPADECCYALFEASTMAEVTAAGALARLEFDRLSSAVLIPAADETWPLGSGDVDGRGQ